MCLFTIDKRFKKNTDERWVFKYFRQPWAGDINFPVYPGVHIERDTWLTSSTNSIESSQAKNPNARNYTHTDYKKYPAGFHCYPTMKDAEKATKYNGSDCIVLRVKVRDVRTAGKQDSYKVLVAREMFVPSKDTTLRAYKMRLKKRAKLRAKRRNRRRSQR